MSMQADKSGREQQIQSLLYDMIPLYQHIGLTVEQARDGRYRCRMPLTRENTNHLGTVHAALQWALAEVLGALAILSIFPPERFSQLYAAVTRAEIDFIKPARGALVAEAELSAGEHDRVRLDTDRDSEGRFALDCAICLEDGSPIARLHGEYIVRPKRLQKAA